MRGMLNALAEGGNDPTRANLPEWLEGSNYDDLVNALPARFTLSPNQFTVTKLEDDGDTANIYADYLMRLCDSMTEHCTLWRSMTTNDNDGHRFLLRRHGGQWTVDVEGEQSGLHGAFGSLQMALP